MANQSRGLMIAGWWQDFCGDGVQSSDDSRESKLERGALKLDLSSDEFFTISTKAYCTTNLLPLRMALLHLDPTEIARADPRPRWSPRRIG